MNDMFILSQTLQSQSYQQDQKTMQEFLARLNASSINLLTQTQTTFGANGGGMTGMGGNNPNPSGSYIPLNTDIVVTPFGSSLKMILDGSQDGQGIWMLTPTPGANTNYTVGMLVVIPQGATMKLQLYDGGSGNTNLYFTGTGNLQFVSLSVTTSSTPLYLHTYIFTTPAQALNGVYLLGAFLHQGALSPVIQLESYQHDQTTIQQFIARLNANPSNLLTENQATCGASGGNTTGFSENNPNPSGSYIPLNTDIAIAPFGSAIKMVLDGVIAGQGLYTSINSPASTTQYIVGMLVVAPLGSKMKLQLYDGGSGNTTQYFTGTGHVQFITNTVTTSSSPSYLKLYITTVTTAQALNGVYLLGAFLHQGAY